MVRIICLNGPPRVGKDSVTRQVIRSLNGAGRIGFADAIKCETHAKFGRPDLPFDHFEAIKDTPVRIFNHATPRQTYIAHANSVREARGQDYYGQLLCERIIASNFNLVMVPDAGKTEETEYVAKRFGYRNVSLIQLKDGRTDFSACNREYLQIDAIAATVIHARHEGEFLPLVAEAVRNELRKAVTQASAPAIDGAVPMPALN